MSGEPDSIRASLDARVLAWMRESPPLPGTGRDRAEAGASAADTRFDTLAREIFAFQFGHCTPYRHFCRARGATPDLQWSTANP